MEEPVVMTGLPMPKIRRPGRPRGVGCNIQLLARLKPGDPSSCIWGCSLKKMNSIRTSASIQKIKLKIRLLEEKKYAIWRVI